MHHERLNRVPTNPSVQLLTSDKARLDGGGSANQAWKRLRSTGTTAAGWADANGFSRALVYAVLRGERKCLRGQSHAIAVALGLKHA
ncbi:DNA-binding protein [Variovorax sp. OK605]|uniref:DNA-binding protein n=1 Tax=Variovorax sp. OK605 TaxID=1855317 RepID=UPI000B825DBC|nr:DNA-binding protein [Variovorax sp. OK605]